MELVGRASSQEMENTRGCWLNRNDYACSGVEKLNGAPA